MSGHWRTVAPALLLILLSIAACTDRTPTSSVSPEGGISAPRASAQGADPVDRYARAIASALADPALRHQVLEDLRDSPFPKHKVHLQSYLRGARGSRITAVAAGTVGMRPEQFLAGLDALPALEFSFSRSIDRFHWTGTPDLVVIGSTASRAEYRAIWLADRI